MEPEPLVTDYQRRVHDVAQQARAVQARIAGIRGVETSGDGAVTVTVNVQGALEQLSFGPAATDLSLTALASTIVATSRRARVRAAREAAEAVEPLVGANSAAMDEVRARLPVDGAPDDPAGGRPDPDDDGDDAGFTRGG